MPGDCKRCKHTQLYPTLEIASDVGGDVYEVKFREGFYLETTSGLFRILPSSRIRLTFNALAEILQTQTRAVFYFTNRSHRDSFVAAYTEYVTWDL